MVLNQIKGLGKKLLEKNNTCKSYKIHDKIISNKIGKQKFYLCQGELNSSTFRPNEKLNSLYPFSERFKVKDELFLESTTIDNLKFENADFIKLDIQGGELDALIGSKKTLNKTLGLEIEVEFQHIYKINHFLTKFEFLQVKICLLTLLGLFVGKETTYIVSMANAFGETLFF